MHIKYLASTLSLKLVSAIMTKLTYDDMTSILTIEEMGSHMLPSFSWGLHYHSHNFVLYNISKSYAFFGWMCKWIMPLYYFFPQNSSCNGTLCLPVNSICFCSSNNLNISLAMFKSKTMSKWGCRFIRLWCFWTFPFY